MWRRSVRRSRGGGAETRWPRWRRGLELGPELGQSFPPPSPRGAKCGAPEPLTDEGPCRGHFHRRDDGHLPPRELVPPGAEEGEGPGELGAPVGLPLSPDLSLSSTPSPRSPGAERLPGPREHPDSPLKAPGRRAGLGPAPSRTDRRGEGSGRVCTQGGGCRPGRDLPQQGPQRPAPDARTLPSADVFRVLGSWALSATRKPGRASDDVRPLSSALDDPQREALEATKQQQNTGTSARQPAEAPEAASWEGAGRQSTGGGAWEAGPCPGVGEE